MCVCVCMCVNVMDMVESFSGACSTWRTATGRMSCPLLSSSLPASSSSTSSLRMWALALPTPSSPPFLSPPLSIVLEAGYFLNNRAFFENLPTILVYAVVVSFSL